MDSVWMVFVVGLLLSVPCWILWRHAPPCPGCGKPLPLFCAPWKKTRRQWVHGGYFCPPCQMEVDLNGNEVRSNAPPVSRAAFLWAVIPTMLVPLVVVIASYLIFYWAMDRIRTAAVTPQGSAVRFSTRQI